MKYLITAAGLLALTLTNTAATADEHTKLDDATIVEMVLTGSNKEARIAQFAKEETENEKVREFAMDIIEDHDELEQQMRDELEIARGAADNPITRFQDQVAERMIESVKRKLSEKPQEQFDVCFLSAASFAHQASIEAMTVAKDHHAQSETLKRMLGEMISTQKRHLKRATRLMDRLEDEGEYARN